MSGLLRQALLGATDALGEIIADGMPPPEGCDGWEYRDIPWVDGLVWNEIVAVIGEGHLSPIAWSDRDRRRRGQLWVSPEGCARLREYAERTIQ